MLSKEYDVRDETNGVHMYKKYVNLSYMAHTIYRSNEIFCSYSSFIQIRIEIINIK